MSERALGATERGEGHPDDETLAALVDDEAASVTAGARAHVDGCARCQGRLEALTVAKGRLEELPPRDAALVDEILARVGRRRFSWALPAAGLAAAAAAVLFVLLPAAPRPGALPDGTFQPRGGGERVQQSVRLEGGAALAPGAPLPSTGARLSVDLISAGGGGWVVVAARDAEGRVTWLRPAWTDAERPPACLSLPEAPASLPAETGVELPPLPVGDVEVILLEGQGSCDVPTLDAGLEQSGAPPGATVLRLQVPPSERAP